MTVEISFQHDTPCRFADPLGLVATSATATLRAANGTVLQTPAVTCATTSTKIATGTLADRLKLGSVSGLSVGDLLVVQDKGLDLIVEIAKIDGSYIYPLTNLPDVPATDAPVKLLRMSATIAALGESYLGRGLSLTWDYTDGTTRRENRQTVECVRSPWAGSVTPGHVAAIMGSAFFQRGTSWGYCALVARRANSQIENRLLATGRRPALFFSGDAFDTAIEDCVRYELARDGHGGGNDPQIQQQAWHGMNGAIMRIVSSLRPYDPNDSGAVERRPAIGSIQLVR